jgi:glutathione S-transferase
MVLKLYGIDFATCTRRVGALLYEKQIPFELIPVDILKEAQKAPEHLKNQPFGRIPYIIVSN